MAECKDEDALTSSLHSCANDPDFAVICAFLQKFGKDLGIEMPSFKQLQEWLTNTDEVANQLRDLHIKLLRKTRKTVHEKSWESSLSKFCFTYSAQDAWEVERFGYKKSGLKVKLRIFRELLESQFERNVKFRAKVQAINADSMRSEPIGRDRLGHAYWLTQDGDCNLRIYQEHLDEEIWQVVATNRDEFVNLIARLRGNEVVLPSTDIGAVDEDSSSNSCTVPVEKQPPPEERDDSQEEEAKVPNLRIKLSNGNTALSAATTTATTISSSSSSTISNNGTNNSINSSQSTIAACDKEGSDVVANGKLLATTDRNKNVNDEEQTIKSESNEKKVEETGSEDNEIKASHKKVKPLLISQAKLVVTSGNGACNVVNTSKKRMLDEVDNSPPPVRDESNALKRPRPTLLDSKRAKKPSRYEKPEDDYEEDEDDDDGDDDENDSEDEEDDEQEHDDDVGGEGDDGGEEEEGEEEDIDSAAAEEDENEEKEIEEDDDNEYGDYEDYGDNDGDDAVGEAIEEKTMIVRGEGSGAKCKGGYMQTFCEVQRLFPFDFDTADFDGNTDVTVVGEPIEEDVLYVYGVGYGFECTVGNTKNEVNESSTATTTSSPSVEPQATFFFGQPGCLKLSPMKQSSKTDLFKIDGIESSEELEAEHSHLQPIESVEQQLPVEEKIEDEDSAANSGHENEKSVVGSGEVTETKEDKQQLLKNCSNSTSGTTIVEQHLEANGDGDGDSVVFGAEKNMSVTEKSSGNSSDVIAVELIEEMPKESTNSKQLEESARVSRTEAYSKVMSSRTLEVEGEEPSPKLNKVNDSSNELTGTACDNEAKQIENEEKSSHTTTNKDCVVANDSTINCKSLDEMTAEIELSTTEDTAIINASANVIREEITKSMDEPKQPMDDSKKLAADVIETENKDKSKSGEIEPINCTESKETKLLTEQRVDEKVENKSSVDAKSMNAKSNPIVDVRVAAIEIKHTNSTTEVMEEEKKAVATESAEILTMNKQTSVSLEEKVKLLADDEINTEKISPEVVERVEHAECEVKSSDATPHGLKVNAEKVTVRCNMKSSDDLHEANMLSAIKKTGNHAPDSMPPSSSSIIIPPASSPSSSLAASPLPSSTSPLAPLGSPLPSPTSTLPPPASLLPSITSPLASALSPQSLSMISTPACTPASTATISTPSSPKSTLKLQPPTGSTNAVDSTLNNEMKEPEITQPQLPTIDKEKIDNATSNKNATNEVISVSIITTTITTRTTKDTATPTIDAKSEVPPSDKPIDAKIDGCSGTRTTVSISSNNKLIAAKPVETARMDEYHPVAIQSTPLIDTASDVTPCNASSTQQSKNNNNNNNVRRNTDDESKKLTEEETNESPPATLLPPIFQTDVGNNASASTSSSTPTQIVSAITTVTTAAATATTASESVSTTASSVKNVMSPPSSSIKAVNISDVNVSQHSLAATPFSATFSTHGNRKRRLADFAKPQRQSTSESDLDVVSRMEETAVAPIVPLEEEECDDLGDVGGGKRLKMRLKFTNTELRKKVEAQKTAIEETTSSSGEEDLRRRRKIVTPRKQVDKLATAAASVATSASVMAGMLSPAGNRNPKFENSIVAALPMEKPRTELPRQMAVGVVDPLKAKPSKSIMMPLGTIVAPTSASVTSHMPATIMRATPLSSATPTASIKPHKPTLAEIIEKKLKKTPEKSGMMDGSDASSSGVENALLTFSPPKKSPITKPLKKNLLTQLRHEESEEEAIPRKRTNSESIAAPGNTIKTDEVLQAQSQPQPQSSNALMARKTPERKTPDRKTPERQRKRRSSEEVKPLAADVQQANEAADIVEGVSEKLKKNNDEVSSQDQPLSLKMEPKNGFDAVAATVSGDDEKPLRETSNQRDDDLQAHDTVAAAITTTAQTEPQEQPSMEAVAQPVVGRRSGRRGGAQVVYSELPQPKRTRGGALSNAKAETQAAKNEKDDVMKASAKANAPTEEETKKIKQALKQVATTTTRTEVKGKTATATPSGGTGRAETAVNVMKMPKKDKLEDEEKSEKKGAEQSVKQIKTTVSSAADIVKIETVKEKGQSDGLQETRKVEGAAAKIEETLPVEGGDGSETSKTPLRGRGGARRNREVDTSNIIESSDASEAPVRQSRRIALQKIREEAERRKLEEIALRSMKQELKKKKKAEAQADPTVVEPSEHSSSSDEESEVEKKKRVKKKCPGKNGSWSSGSEEQEEPEEEDEEPPHYESDPGSPLFKSDHEFSPESDLEDDAQQAVPMKRARTARKEDAEESGADVCDEQACQKCGKSDHPEWILLCDSCDKGYHCSCLSPVLFYIPEGDWFCPLCQQDQLIVALEQQLKQFDELVERKRLAAEEAQRLLVEEAERAEQARLAEEQERLERKARKKEKHRHCSDDSDGSDDGGSNDDDDEDNEQLSVLQRRRNGEERRERDEVTPRKSSKKSRKSDGSKKKRRRGDGRSRRRAAARGDRQRRRHRIKSSGSESGGGGGSRGGSASESSSGTASGSSSSSSSSSATDSDDEPIYKLRKRRQINVSYRLNEYDDLINSALKKEMDEVAGAGNLGRGKDITTIIEADKEEKARQRHLEDEGDEAKLAAAEGETATTKEAVENEEKVTKSKTDAAAVIEDEDDEDDEPIKRKAKPIGKQAVKKKPRKLTTLDISSEEDNASDEDFKTSSFDDDEEEDTSVSISSNSDSSLEIFRRRGRGSHKKQRKAARRAARERRKDRRFVVDESDDEEEERTHPKSKKKKRKDDSDYTESETSVDGDDDELSELTENMDSADLCDDTTSEDSDGAWQPSKRKKQKKSQGGIGGGGAGGVARKSPKLKKSQTKKPKRVEYSDDDISESEEEDDDDDYAGIGSGKGASGKQPRSQPLKSSESGDKASVGGGCGSGAGSGKGKGKGKAPASKKKKKKCSGEEEDDDESCSDSGDSTRRTRGRRYAYLEDFDDDSSDGGIKPGVKRPDTPPEERQKFIERQEEIKRMLAAKNAEGAKLAATPRLTPIKGQVLDKEKDKRSPAKPSDSLSTVPQSVIRQAKVLDIDYLQRKGEQVGEIENAEDVESEFDDADLPDDFPEDMDEDDIARMVDEEEAAFGATVTAAAAVTTTASSTAAPSAAPVAAPTPVSTMPATTTGTPPESTTQELLVPDVVIRATPLVVPSSARPATAAAVSVTSSIPVVTAAAAAAGGAIVTAVTTIKPAKTKQLPPVPAIPLATIIVPVDKPSVPGVLTTNPSLAALSAMPTPSGLQEPLRKRLPMPTLHPPLMRHHFPAAHLDMPAAHLLQRHAPGAVPPPTHLLQNALSAPLGQPLSRAFSTPPAQLLASRMPGISVVAATSAHIMPPHLMAAAAQTLAPTQSPLQDSVSDDGKPRGRRKKITPLRDTLQKQQTAAAASASTTITTGGDKTQTTISGTPVNTAINTVGVIKSALPTTAPTSTVVSGHPPPPQLYKSVVASGGETTTTTTTPSPQPSVITRMPHLPAGRAGGAQQPPPTSIYAQSPDVVRFYGPTAAQQVLAGARPMPPQAHAQPPRHRLPPQMSGLPPPPHHHGMRPTYGPPPPLRGTQTANHAQSLLPPPNVPTAGMVRGGVYVPSTQASDLHATSQQLSAVYGGAPQPPPARSAAPHLNPYRPHIYGNPNYAPPPPRGVPPSASNLRTGPPPPHAADYVAGARVYPPYGYYPPPPPLTAHQSAVPPPSTHSTLASAPSSVIVSAPPAAANISSLSSSSSSSSARVITKSPSPSAAAALAAAAVAASAAAAAALNSKSVIESRKKLTTLDSYAIALNKSPLAIGGESSGSRSSPGMQTDGAEDSSSAPTASSAANMAATASSSSEGQASEFSGLVSYFSSQHDDYNS